MHSSLFRPPMIIADTWLQNFLQEDLGLAGDITSQLTVAPNTTCCAVIVARQSGRVSGLPFAERLFQLFDDKLSVTLCREDGDQVDAGSSVLRAEGAARSILAVERTALNLLSHLSGIASLTAQYVGAVSEVGSRARVCATRKTLPGLRALQKYAVICGGGSPHRSRMDAAILIKDNHRALVSDLGQAIHTARHGAGHMIRVEVEVENIDELTRALEAGADVILLDNMKQEDLVKAVALARGRALTEASGGITLANIASIAQTGVDFISVGALTHSVPALDLSLEISV